MSGVKSIYSLKKQVKALQKEIAERESKEAFYRLDILERTTEFVNQMEVIFGLVDYIFDPEKNEGIATLGEARRRWEEFKRVVDESQCHKKTMETLGIEIVVHSADNSKMIMDGWNKSRGTDNE